MGLGGNPSAFRVPLLFFYMAKQFSPEVVWIPLAKIIPYALNNKHHPLSQVDAIAASIVEYGFDVPIVIDEDKVILKGHGRYLAAQKLGLAKVPVIVRSDLSTAQKKACRIADNKVAISDWDYDSLKVELESLKELDFKLDLTGFTLEECDRLFTLPVVDFGDRQIFGEDGNQNTTQNINRNPEPNYQGDAAIAPSLLAQDSERLTSNSSDNFEAGESGTLLALANVTIAEPRHQLNKGEVWRLDQHVLVVADVLTEWQQWINFLAGDAIFAPYPGAFVPLTMKAAARSIVMVQPDVYIAGHILDQYVAVKGESSVQRI